MIYVFYRTYKRAQMNRLGLPVHVLHVLVWGGGVFSSHQLDTLLSTFFLLHVPFSLVIPNASSTAAGASFSSTPEGRRGGTCRRSSCCTLNFFPFLEHLNICIGAFRPIAASAITVISCLKTFLSSQRRSFLPANFLEHLATEVRVAKSIGRPHRRCGGNSSGSFQIRPKVGRSRRNDSTWTTFTGCYRWYCSAHIGTVHRSSILGTIPIFHRRVVRTCPCRLRSFRCDLILLCKILLV